MHLYDFTSGNGVALGMACALSGLIPQKVLLTLSPPPLLLFLIGEFHLPGKWSVLSEHKLQIIVPFGRRTAGSLDEQSGWVKVDAWEFTDGWRQMHGYTCVYVRLRVPTWCVLCVRARSFLCLFFYSQWVWKQAGVGWGVCFLTVCNCPLQ